MGWASTRCSPITLAGSRDNQPARSSSLSTRQANIDFALDERPLLCCPQFGDQRVERTCVFRGIVEPGQEIERLGRTQVAAMVEAPRNSGQIPQSRCDVA